MKNLISLALLCLSVSVSLAQKTEGIVYKGNYKNIPVYLLDISGYEVEYSIDAYTRDIIDQKELQLHLKGYEKGNDLKIVLYVSEPQTSARVEKIKTIINDDVVDQYRTHIIASSYSKLLVINKEGILIQEFSVKPDSKEIVVTGKMRSSYTEAAEELEDAKRKSSGHVERKYTIELFKSYQEELDDRFGVYNRVGDMGLYTIKTQKFEYYDFNAATIGFHGASESNNLESPENAQAIKYAISIWEKYVTEYKPGNKSRVSDKNIDIIYFNLVMGYLTLGDGNKLQHSWDKFLSTKSDIKAKEYANKIVPKMIYNHVDYVQAKDRPFEPVKLISDEQLYNNMLFLNGFFSYYLTGISKERETLVNCFPAQQCFINSAEAKILNANGSKETIKLRYDLFGKINTLVYSTKNESNEDINYNFTFEYINDKISRVLKDGKQLFSLEYRADKISVLKQIISDKKYVTYKFTQSGSGRTDISHTSYLDNIPQENQSNNYILHNKNSQITSIQIEPFGAKELLYDKYGNISEMTIHDKNQNTESIKFKNVLDEMGNSTNADSEKLKIQSSFNYHF